MDLSSLVTSNHESSYSMRWNTTSTEPLIKIDSLEVIIEGFD